jgi:hypothetical protein
MPGPYYGNEASGRIRVDERQVVVARSAVLAGSAFELGLATELLLNDAAKRMYERTRGQVWHRGYERTVTYDPNRPDSLSRREPAPHAGQPRYGTGAISSRAPRW